MTSPHDDDWISELRDLVPADPPEPWGDADGDEPELTSAQRAFLADLIDMPPVPRLRDIDVATQFGGHSSENDPGT